MIGEVLLVIGMISLIFGLYLLREARKKPETYLWVGPGEDPFK